MPHLCRPNAALGTHGSGIRLVDCVCDCYLMAELGEAVDVCDGLPLNGIMGPFLQV